MRTGYPVMIVVVVVATETEAIEFFRSKKLAVVDIVSIARMMKARNNKMKYLIAKYF
jgi:hypothetical protein